MKKRWIAGGIAGGAFLFVLVSFLLFCLGKQAGKETEETKVETEVLFLGKESVILSPTVDGALCDFSAQEIPLSLVSLADDLLEKIEELEQVEEVSACYLRTGASVFHGIDGFSDGTIFGVDEGFLSAAGMMVELGRGITERDMADGNRVALLDGKAVQKLFHGKDPIGETVELEGILYQVVGIVGFSTAGTGNGIILIPESTWAEVYRYEEPKSVVMRTEENADQKQMLALAERILNSMIQENCVIRYMRF